MVILTILLQERSFDGLYEAPFVQAGAVHPFEPDKQIVQPYHALEQRTRVATARVVRLVKARTLR